MNQRYRVWQKQEKKMRDVTMINFASKDSLLVEFSRPEQGDSIWQSTDDDLILMRATGRQDKDGKDVFEGDIVRASYEGDDYETSQVIKWNEDGGYFLADEFGFDYLPCLGHDGIEIEVIGNVYENPDLLPKAA